MISAPPDVGRVEEKTVINIAGRRLPVMWVMTDMPIILDADGDMTDWWADMVAAVPMENGYYAVVVRPKPDNQTQWSVCLSHPMRSERWGMAGDDDTLDCIFANNENEVLDAILKFSELHTGSV